MPSVVDAFDRVVCINLDERQDRWQQVQESIASMQMGISAERFSAIKPDLAREPIYNGRAGCLLSHRAVIEQAYRDGLESVLVLEDDLCFDLAFPEKIGPTIASLQQVEWDVFYLGFTPKAPLLHAGDGLVRTLGGMTTHAVAYHRGAMPELLKRLPDAANALCFLARHKSIDRYYCQHIAPRMRCYASCPPLIFQRDDFSDIQQRQAASNREQACRAFEKYLIHKPTPATALKLQIGRVFRKVKADIDGHRRALLRPIKAK